MADNSPSTSSKIPEKYRGGVAARGKGSPSSGSDGQSSSRSLSRSLVLIALGLVLALAAAVADAYLHRGIETSADPPFVLQVSGRDLATNVDLRDFPSVQVETIASTLRANGFRYVRHPFLWSELEPNRGQYNWEPFDAIVTSLDDAGLEIIAVISGTPDWARSQDQIGSADAPPDDSRDFGDFVAAFAGRYGQYVNYYQIGDQPNLAANWGGAPATPSEYLTVLAPSFNAVRTADPDAFVLLAEFNPMDQNGSYGADLAFLQGIYDADGTPYFDVVAASISGGTTSPFNRRVNSGSANLSRAILFRELMRAEGDEAKPIWLTHYGWDASGSVSPDQQADYLVAGLDRIREEWPWAGPVFQWGLQPATLPPDQTGYALLNSDGTASASFLAVTALEDSTFANVAPTGFVPTDTSPVTLQGSWANQHLNGVIFETTSEVGASVSIRFKGTGLVGFLRVSPEAGLLEATVDGQPLPGWPVENGVSVIDLSFYQAEDISVTLADDLEEGVHEVTMTLATPGRVTLGGAVVSRNPPLRWPIVVALVSALVLLIYAIRDLALLAAQTSGLLKPETEGDGSPALPTLPDWRPSFRT